VIWVKYEPEKFYKQSGDYLLRLEDRTYAVASWDPAAEKWLTEYGFIDPSEVTHVSRILEPWHQARKWMLRQPQRHSVQLLRTATA